MAKEENFETEVLTRLAVIESKLDGYKEIKKVVYETENRSRQNEIDIQEIKENNKWLKRTVVSQVIRSYISSYCIVRRFKMRGEQNMSNKVYDVLKWVALVFLPALITFYGVIGNTCSIPYTDIVLTIAVAFNTFLGTCLGISNINYKNKEE